LPKQKILFYKTEKITNLLNRLSSLDLIIDYNLTEKGFGLRNHICLGKANDN